METAEARREQATARHERTPKGAVLERRRSRFGGKFRAKSAQRAAWPWSLREGHPSLVDAHVLRKTRASGIYRGVTSFVRFSGTDSYLTNDALETAVNCALALERPLLVKGEPGTGKTLLAEAIADTLGLPLIH